METEVEKTEKTETETPVVMTDDELQRRLQTLRAMGFET